MAGARNAVVEAVLTLTEILVSGLVLVIFFVAWFGLALVRAVLSVPGALMAVRARRLRSPLVVRRSGAAG